MREAYSYAYNEIVNALSDGGKCLDCGAGTGQEFEFLKNTINIEKDYYYGIEWSEKLVQISRNEGLNIKKNDLNKKLDFPNNNFKCIFGLSVLEHLVNPCRYLEECYRCLEEKGTLVILTPNISTYFTIFQLLSGEMPSSGPHPDLSSLQKQIRSKIQTNQKIESNVDMDTPEHRHMIVFSYRALKRYLETIGFKNIKIRGFGLYPFPIIMQPILERIDPYHCHQLVFMARKI